MKPRQFIHRTLSWGLWSILHFLRFTVWGRKPATMDEWVLWNVERIGFPPWWRFKPFVHPWPDEKKVSGREFVWDNEGYFVTGVVPLNVQLYVTFDDKQVVGFLVMDKAIRDALKKSTGRLHDSFDARGIECDCQWGSGVHGLICPEHGTYGELF